MILGDPAFRLSVLDLFAGNGALLEHCRQTWRECQRLRSEWNQLTERLDKMAAERDYQEARYRRLEEARLRDGELEELEAEQTRLANAEEIKQSLSAVGELLSPSAGDRPGLVASLKEAARQLSGRQSIYLSFKSFRSVWRPPGSNWTTSSPKWKGWMIPWSFLPGAWRRSRSGCPSCMTS